MSIFNRKNLILLFLLAFLGTPAAGAFNHYGLGSRGAGKGGAFFTFADDSSGAEWNPASLVNSEGLQALFEYNRPFAQLPGVDISHAFAAASYEINESLAGGFSFMSFRGDDLYRANTYRFTVAAREPAAAGINFISGFSLKYLHHSYDFDSGTEADQRDPVTEIGDSAGALTADIGVIFKPVENLPVGLSLKNLIPADVGIENKDTVPIEAGVGAGFRLNPEKGVFRELLPEIFFSYRDQKWGKSLDKINAGAGIELWTSQRRLGLRTGINRHEASLGGSYSFDIGSDLVRLDYTAMLPFSRLSDHLGHHRISISYRFSTGPEKEKKEPREKARVLFSEAQELFARGMYEESIEGFKAVLSIIPGHELSLTNIERAKGKLEEKRRKSEKEYLQKRASILFTEGQELFSQGKYEESIERFKAVLSIIPGHELSLTNIERAKRKIREREE